MHYPNDISDYDITVLDFETTTDGYENSPRACYRSNKIIASHYKHVYSKNHNDVTPTLIVGHNLLFDLEYWMREKNERWESFLYWDTAIADYLLSGHVNKFPSLEDSCANAHVPYTKRIDIGAWLASGKKMTDIPQEELDKYVVEDVEATYALFCAQWKEAEVKGQRDLIINTSNSIPFLASIGLNGLSFDVEQTCALIQKYDEESTELYDELVEEITGRYPAYDPEVFKSMNLLSPKSLSAILFGLPSVIDVKHLPLEGQPKPKGKGRKYVTTSIKFDNPYIKRQDPLPDGKTQYSTDVNSLLAYKTTAPTSLLSNILKYRELEKLMGTYLGPLTKRALLEKHHKIYGTIHTTSTASGRLSSSSPNMQNMPPDIRKLFYYKDSSNIDYQIVEIDFKQLELTAIAELLNCPQLIKAINDDEDVIHNVYQYVYGPCERKNADKTRRTYIKNVVYGMCYGGGANTLSTQSGVPIDLVRQILTSFDRLYPLRPGYNVLETELRKNKTYRDGFETFYRCLKTERIHTFGYEPSPDWLSAVTGEQYSLSPTKWKNYMFQGFAGGDVVPTFCRALFYLVGGHLSSARFINTVHDSLVLAIPLNYTEKAVSKLNTHIEQARLYVNKYFNMSVELKVNITYTGKYWS